MRLRPPAWLGDLFVRCPAVPIAATMMLGIILARFMLPIWPWTAVSFGVACLIAAASVGRHRPWLASLALVLAAGFGAIAAADIATYRFPADEIGLYAGDDAKLCRLRLYLPNEPRLRSVSFASRLPFPPTQTTLAEVREILTRGDQWRPASGTVLLQVHQVVSDLAAGQTIEVIARLERPGIAMNPGQFDWQRYYREQGILCDVQVRRADNLVILDRSRAPLLTRWREGCRAMLARGFTKAQSLDHALIAALVLGDYDPELRDVKEQFRDTGTSHHLAISGMHIAVVAGLVFLLARLAGVRPRGCWIAALVVISAYACAAMPSPPVMRAVILFGVAGGAFLCGRFAATVHLLGLTVAIMMSLHPPDLFNAGFQLSFGTVLGLMLLSEPLAARLAGSQHILMPDEVERLPPRARLIRWIDRWHMQVWTSGLLAWLISMPLVALNFTRLNPWQVPASIVLAPLVTLSLVGGVVKIVGTFLCPPLAPMLATLAAFPSAVMRDVVAWLATWPYADIPLAAPPVWLVVLCWISIALCIRRWQTVSMRYATIVLLLATFLYLLAGPYLFGSARTLSAGQMRITLMAVGAGQCAVVEQAGGRTVLLDCGSSSLTDLTSNVVVPVLREYGITHLDTIFVSHADNDHFSGVAEIADAYNAREIVVADAFEHWAREKPAGITLLKQLATLDLPPRTAHPGDHIPLGRDAAIDILWPPRDFVTSTDNDVSLVLRLTKAGRSMLFTGDIQTGGLRGLLADGPIHSDILVAPHHGSSEESTPAFVGAVAPAWIVSSNDRTLSGKQLTFDSMMTGRRVMRTNDYGAITILIDADGTMRVEGFVKRAPG